LNEGYTVRQKSTYIINKIVHIYQSNLQMWPPNVKKPLQQQQQQQQQQHLFI